MHRIYYSHAMCTYHTLTEKQELSTIGRIFPNYKIVDPGAYQDNLEKARRGMSYCLELVESCNALVFSRILGKVTAGVGKEVRHALLFRRPVFELVGHIATAIHQAPRSVSRETTIGLYEDWEKQNVQHLS